MSDNKKALVIIPTYNESENVANLYRELSEVLPDIEILFVDDNSPDGTAKVVLDIKKNNNRVHLLSRPGKLGIGSAHRDGILWAYRNGFKKVVTMDADLTHSPSVIPRMLQWADEVDIVVASRFLRPGSLPGWALIRRLLTYLGHYATRFILKIRFDATGGLRAYNLQSLPIEIFRKTRANGYAFLFESLYLFCRNGAHIVEIPIILPARIVGSSKMNFSQVVESVLHLWRLYVVERTCPELQELKMKERNEIGIDNISNNEDTSDQWSSYWLGEDRPPIQQLLYELASTVVRTCLVRPQLNRIATKLFSMDSDLLHAGCGSGQVDQQLRHRFNISAVDLSSAAVRHYNCLNEPIVKALTANITSLPFPDKSFDGVYNLGVMEHMTDSEICAGFKEFYRVLRPEGKLLLFWPPKRSLFGFILRFFGLIRSDQTANASSAFIPPEINLLESSTQVAKWLNQEGFELNSCARDWRDLGIQYAVVATKVKR